MLLIYLIIVSNWYLNFDYKVECLYTVKLLPCNIIIYSNMYIVLKLHTQSAVKK